MSAATYIINHLPKIDLSMLSSFENLFNHSPNIIKLRVFCCLCWCRPYTTHKLDARSSPCVFVGYSLTQSAYLCLDPVTNKLCTSRHVEFVEDQFPFTFRNPTPPSLSDPPVDVSIPLPPPVSSSPPTAAPPPPPDPSPPPKNQYSMVTRS